MTVWGRVWVRYEQGTLFGLLFPQLHVATLTGGGVVKDFHFLPGGRVGEALAGGLPAAVQRSAGLAIAPALEQGAEDDHNANPECLYTGSGDAFEHEKHADGAQ